MSRKVFLDLDGVLVDFVGGAAKVHGYDPLAVRRWDYFADVGLTAQAFWAPLGFEFWRDLGWTTDGRDILEAVESFAGPENVCLLTNPGDTPGCASGKHEWVKREMPAYSRRFLIGPAKRFLAGPGRVLVDDSDANVLAFAYAGGSTALVPRPWNACAGLDPVIEVRGTLAYLDKPSSPAA